MLATIISAFCFLEIFSASDKLKNDDIVLIFDFLENFAKFFAGSIPNTSTSYFKKFFNRVPSLLPISITNGLFIFF